MYQYLVDAPQDNTLLVVFDDLHATAPCICVFNAVVVVYYTKLRFIILGGVRMNCAQMFTTNMIIYANTVKMYIN